MTPKQFQESPHSEKLRAFLAEPAGQATINVLASLLPLFSTSEILHIFSKEIGKREGFEHCIKSLVALATPPKVQTEIEANYGVPDVKPM